MLARTKDMQDREKKNEKIVWIQTEGYLKDQFKVLENNFNYSDLNEKEKSELSIIENALAAKYKMTEAATETHSDNQAQWHTPGPRLCSPQNKSFAMSQYLHIIPRATSPTTNPMHKTSRIKAVTRHRGEEAGSTVDIEYRCYGAGSMAQLWGSVTLALCPLKAF